MNHPASASCFSHCPQCDTDIFSNWSGKSAPDFCLKCRFPLMLVAGKYRMERVLGEGGFGVIYQARHIHLTRDPLRVIKVIKPEIFALEGMQSRFEREVQVTSALSQRNPHIVRIYDDFGEIPNLGYFYVMEFLEGETLEELAGRSSSLLPMKLCYHLFLQLCEAMEGAHDEEIIHRDLKPDNLFIIGQGREPTFLKVIDFGIAKPVGQGEVTNLTQGALGTPFYMAPEQFLNQKIGPWTDIYAMGIILYEMLAGRFPFFPREAQEDGSLSVMQIMAAHSVKKPPPLQEVSLRQESLPVEMDEVLQRALAKKPHDRFPSVLAFEDAFRQALSRPMSLPSLFQRSLLPQEDEAEEATALDLRPPSVAWKAEERGDAASAAGDFALGPGPSLEEKAPLPKGEKRPTRRIAPEERTLPERRGTPKRGMPLSFSSAEEDPALEETLGPEEDPALEETLGPEEETLEGGAEDPEDPVLEETVDAPASVREGLLPSGEGGGASGEGVTPRGPGPSESFRHRPVFLHEAQGQKREDTGPVPIGGRKRWVMLVLVLFLLAGGGMSFWRFVLSSPSSAPGKREDGPDPAPKISSRPNPSTERVAPQGKDSESVPAKKAGERKGRGEPPLALGSPERKNPSLARTSPGKERGTGHVEGSPERKNPSLTRSSLHFRRVPPGVPQGRRSPGPSATGGRSVSAHRGRSSAGQLPGRRGAHQGKRSRSRGPGRRKVRRGRWAPGCPRDALFWVFVELPRAQRGKVAPFLAGGRVLRRRKGYCLGSRPKKKMMIRLGGGMTGFVSCSFSLKGLLPRVRVVLEPEGELEPTSADYCLRK